MLKDKAIVGFVMHDPVGNAEAFMEEATPEQLEAAQADGIVFLAVYADGERQIIDASDVDFSRIGLGGSLNVMEQEVTVPILNAIFTTIEEIKSNGSSSSDKWQPPMAGASPGSGGGTADPLEALRDLMQGMNERYADATAEEE